MISVNAAHVLTVTAGQQAARASRYVQNSSYRAHSITRQQFLTLLEWQQYRCAYCGVDLDFAPKDAEGNTRKSSRFVIDHDHACCDFERGSRHHSCGHCIRGVLCLDCNVMVDSLLAPPALRHHVRQPLRYRVLQGLVDRLGRIRSRDIERRAAEGRLPVLELDDGRRMFDARPHSSLAGRLEERARAAARRIYVRESARAMRPVHDAYVDSQRLAKVHAVLWPDEMPRI